MAARDGYNKRYNHIIKDVDREAKSVDNMIFWDKDDNLATHWWRTIDYLTLVGKQWNRSKS